MKFITRGWLFCQPSLHFGYALKIKQRNMMYRCCQVIATSPFLRHLDEIVQRDIFVPQNNVDRMPESLFKHKRCTRTQKPCLALFLKPIAAFVVWIGPVRCVKLSGEVKLHRHHLVEFLCRVFAQ